MCKIYKTCWIVEEKLFNISIHAKMIFANTTISNFTFYFYSFEIEYCINKKYVTKSKVNIFLTYIIIGNLRPLPRPLTQEKIFQGALMKVWNVDMFTCANNSLLFLRDVHDDFYSQFFLYSLIKYV